MSSRIAGLIGATALCVTVTVALAQEPARRSMFTEGECSGVLCSTIGGSQAPQNQPRKSLFPEGQCGGILCSSIGGSQAPKHAEAPPACGGGLLCDMAPYAMGQPFIKPDEAQQRAQAVASAPAASAAPVRATKVSSHRRKAKVSKQTASAN